MDNYEDLKPIKKPLFLSELIMSLQSENHEKFTLAIDSAEDLVRNQSHNDLEVMSEDLLQLLFRIQNKFTVESFSIKKFRTIQALLER